MESSLNFVIEENITAQSTWRAKEKFTNRFSKTNKELEDYAQIVSHDLKSPCEVWTLWYLVD
jgi:light-regulated signal transduction histidine kinase (bacteriophytochrome)